MAAQQTAPAGLAAAQAAALRIRAMIAQQQTTSASISPTAASLLPNLSTTTLSSLPTTTSPSPPPPSSSTATINSVTPPDASMVAASLAAVQARVAAQRAAAAASAALSATIIPTTTSSSPTTISTSRAVPAAATAAGGGGSDNDSQVQGTAEWPWAKASASEPRAVNPLRDNAGDAEYTLLANATMKGLRKLGYTGGPVMSDREAAGIKFGLHRSNFHKADFHSIKLLVGMDVDTSNAMGFPLLDRLRGPGSVYILHIMRSCAQVLVEIQGKGSINVIGMEQSAAVNAEPLHFRLAGTDTLLMSRAQAMADSLIASVKKDFDAHHHAYITRLHAVSTAAASTAAAITATISARPATDSSSSSSTSSSKRRFDEKNSTISNGNGGNGDHATDNDDDSSKRTKLASASSLTTNSTEEGYDPFTAGDSDDD